MYRRRFFKDVVVASVLTAVGIKMDSDLQAGEVETTNTVHSTADMQSPGSTGTFDADTTMSVSSHAQRAVSIDFPGPIHLSDGEQLSAQMWRPAETIEPRPVVFSLSPYGTDYMHEYGMTYARQGLIFVAVDLRGRGASTGTFVPLASVGRDGKEVAEWLLRQPWCDGRLAMEGSSYRGAVQWQVAAAGVPELNCIVPVSPLYPGYDFPYYQNIQNPYLPWWMSLVSYGETRFKLFRDFDYWRARLSAAFRNYRPFIELKELAGEHKAVFDQWANTSPLDPHWDSLSPTEHEYQQMKMPILSITGHFDDSQRATLKYFREHQQYASADAVSKHHLLIGPYNHLNLPAPTKSVGGLEFGNNAIIDMPRLRAEWFGHIFYGAPKPRIFAKRITYYVMGLNEWKCVERLEDASNQIHFMFLGKEKSGNKVGSLMPIPQEHVTTTGFTYDPLDLSDYEVYPEFFDESERENGLIDDSCARTSASMVYDGPPLTEPLEIAGNPKVKLWVRLNVPDTDFQATLFELLQDGSVIRLANCKLRARYRQPGSETLIVPGEINAFEFSDFNWLARQLSIGSRIRLVIHSINTPFWGKNYNSGGNVTHESERDARIAQIEILQGGAYRSNLELPIFKATSEL